MLYAENCWSLALMELAQSARQTCAISAGKHTNAHSRRRLKGEGNAGISQSN